MRLLVPFSVWLGVLHLQGAEPGLPETPGGILSTAALLAGLTVMVYRLGVWRQEMQNTKHNIGTEVVRLREECTRNFANLDRRLGLIDQALATAQEQRVTNERWQAKTDTTVAAQDRELAAVAQRVERLEGISV